MCGIAGIITFEGQPEHTRQLQTMLDRIQHRGPDNTGISIYQNRVYFGHLRLSIIDLEEHANQPFEYQDLSMVYNGEIYNYIELKKELVELGHQFQTQSDTEVLIHAFAQWGNKCVHRLRGMWSFCIFDKSSDTLFASRDPFGIKPFYYSRSENEFQFCSEMKGLVNTGTRPNLEICSEYLLSGLSDHKESTFFENILELPPGHNLEVSVANLEIDITKYYQFEDTQPNKKSFQEVFSDSVRLHLRSDVPIGSCLSGGVDSSAVTAIAVEFANGFQAFTIKSEEKETDESHLASEVAQALNIPINIDCPTYPDFKRQLDDCIYFQEGPMVSSSIFLQYRLMSMVKKNQVKVILSGQGGDEALLGYERYFTTHLYSQIRKFRFYDFFRDFRYIVKNSKLSAVQLIKFLIYFQSKSIKFLRLKSQTPWVKKQYHQHLKKIISKDHTDFSDLLEMQKTELTRNQLPRLLRYEDRNSMAFSLEGRVPIVDKEVIEKALSLPLKSKINRGFTKFALRQCIDRRLPDTIVWRKIKFGFEPPEKKWFAAHKDEMKKEIERSDLIKNLLDSIPSLDSLERKYTWRLYNLAVWNRIYFETENKGERP